MTIEHTETGTRARAAQRGVEVVGGALLFVLALPVMVACVAASAVTLRANPFFVQQRIGRRGVPFSFLKIRTLPTSAPMYATKHEIRSARVPRVCALLRRFHLDELPQLALVVLGRMSLVGPRPEMPVLHDGMDGQFGRDRTVLRPGCTGLWQISSASVGLIHEAPEYDDYYLENQNLRLDAWILGQTVLVMLGRRPRIVLDDIPQWTRPRRPALALAGELG